MTEPGYESSVEVGTKQWCHQYSLYRAEMEVFSVSVAFLAPEEVLTRTAETINEGM